MNSGRRLWLVMLTVSLVVSLPYAAVGQDATAQAAGRNIADMKLGPAPGLPTCVPGAIQSGDPSRGPFIVLAKQSAGCVVPWHSHSANEHVMMVSGVDRIDLKEGKSFTLRAGGFALIPARHLHQARCTAACTLYVYSDGAFDIHYVNAQGKEISPESALKAVGEKTIQPMK